MAARHSFTLSPCHVNWAKIANTACLRRPRCGRASYGPHGLGPEPSLLPSDPGEACSASSPAAARARRRTLTNARAAAYAWKDSSVANCSRDKALVCPGGVGPMSGVGIGSRAPAPTGFLGVDSTSIRALTLSLRLGAEGPVLASLFFLAAGLAAESVGHGRRLARFTPRAACLSGAAAPCPGAAGEPEPGALVALWRCATFAALRALRSAARWSEARWSAGFAARAARACAFACLATARSSRSSFARSSSSAAPFLKFG